MPKGPALKKMRAGKEEEEEEAEDMMEEESGDDSEEDGEPDEEEMQESIQVAVGALSSLPNPLDVHDALQEVKKQIATLVYTSQVAEHFKSIVEHPEAGVFAAREAEGLVELFHRCMVSEHSVYKDNEWTLGARRDACGACTSLVLEAEDGDVQITMTWYWRYDEQEGFVEEFSLVQDADEEEDEDDEEDEDEDEPAGRSKGGPSSSSSKPRPDAGQDPGPAHGVTLLEGQRTRAGVALAEVNVEGLSALEETLKSGLCLQSLLRFFLLCARTESSKIQGKLSSVTQGYDADEDRHDICAYLASFEVKGHAPGAAKPAAAKGAGKQAKRGGMPGSAGASDKKKQRR